MIVAGIGTDVGKSVVAAILTTLFEGAYWKPIQCGPEPMEPLLGSLPIYPPAYRLKASSSPHQAAKIDPAAIVLPKSKRTLIVESCGGLLVPLTPHFTTLDLFSEWSLPWIVVSRHYLGSINHTLLTLEVLKQRKVKILGLIFNGEPDLEKEKAILNLSNVPLLNRLLPEAAICRNTIERYAKLWSGTPLPK